MTPRPERIRPADVARITGLSRRQVQAMAQAGLLPSAAKLGSLWTFDERRIRAARRSDGSKLPFGGDDLFRLTRAGADQALEPGERLDPEDFPR